MRSLFSRFLLLALLLLAAGPIGAEEPVSVTSDKESLVTFPGPWAFQLGKACIILVSDQELEILAADPDKAINMAVTFDKVVKSLRQVCVEA